MLLSPAIMALVGVSVVVTLLMLLAAAFAIQVLRFWDISSGSERQLNLERRTYLISTILTYAFVAELVSLLLFIYNAEEMSSQFVGAMCATGVININGYGWPTLFLKVAIFFSGAAWLMLNALDNKGYDYPLVKMKYGLLLFIVPMMVAELAVQLLYFLNMDPDVITSCCGALFTPESTGVAAEVSAVEPATAMIALIVSGVATLLSGSWYLLKQKGGSLYAGLSVTSFVVALVAIVSCVALYIYEHPHHHCPFCILKPGHDFMGYYLYIPLFAATALALGIGITAPWRNIPSLAKVVVSDTRRFTWLSLIFFVLFYAVAAYAVASSNLTMMDVWW